MYGAAIIKALLSHPLEKYDDTKVMEYFKEHPLNTELTSFLKSGTAIGIGKHINAIIMHYQMQGVLQ